MRFGSLFAGIGGFDLGFERAGMECAWQVEIDEYCQKVLTKHWPDVPRYGDIRDVGKENLEAVDLVCGGFPCQPFSVAGKQRGEEDDRHLWPEMLRIISELKPKWVVGENVPGIIPLFLDQAIADLEAEGYTTEQFVIPACAFDAPHKRDRLFIIAYANENREPNQPVNEQRKISRAMDVANAKNGKRNDISIAKECRKPERATGRCDFKNVPSSQGQQDGGGGFTWEDATGIQGIPEPTIRRMDDGFSSRMDRIRALGNAVVPQVAQFIGVIIMEADNLTPSQDMVK